MEKAQIQELAFYIAEARRILNESGHIESAQYALDHAAALIPDECWPTNQELNAPV